jgi:predicted O-methyltransferase YrrM
MRDAHPVPCTGGAGACRSGTQTDQSRRQGATRGLGRGREVHAVARGVEGNEARTRNWVGLGLRETGGKLVTIEYDKARASEAAANINKAGLSDVVRVVSGDAFAEIPKVAGTFDFVFCDAWKRDYQKFFSMVLPRMEKGGLFLGHNVINKRDEMGDFLKTIHTSPAVLTSIVAPSGEGISITLKR